jgi:hypothetical protein
MKILKKTWAQIILIIIILLPISIVISPIILSEQPITQLQTRIFIYQLVFGFVLGSWALYLAKKQIILIDKQINLSKEQIKISKEQKKVSIVLHNISNNDELISWLFKILDKHPNDKKLSEDVWKQLNKLMNNQSVLRKELSSIE